MFKMKTQAAAVLALLASGQGFAQVNLDATAPVPISYASERNISTATTLRDGAAADQRARALFGASLGTDVPAYARLDLGGAKFAGTVNPAMFSVSASVNAANISVSQSGDGYVIFAVTPQSGANLVGSNQANIDTDVGALTGLVVESKGDVTLRYRLFETLTAAANPAPDNTLKDTQAVKYVEFTRAFGTAVSTSSAVADVGANPSYTAFVAAGGSATLKPLGTITGTLSTRALISGAAAGVTDLLQPVSTVTATGDFMPIRNADSTYTGAALARLTLNSANDCSGANINAATLDAATATFTLSAAQAASARTLCMNLGTGSYEINPGTYALSASYTAQANFTLPAFAAATSGTITRNGVRMVAPLVNQPAGWFSRLVMTNTGSADRQYTISTMSENGTLVTAAGAGAAGTLASMKTTLIDLPSVVSITPGAGLGVRASLVVTVNAPQSEIDGLYQIVSPTGSALSNYVLVYKN